MTPKLLLCPLFAALLLIAPAARAADSPQFPDTPAGKAVAAWLAQFNSGDPVQMRQFDAIYPRKDMPSIEDRLAFREATGGFSLVRIEKSEPTAISVLLQERDSDMIAHLEIQVSADDPPKILNTLLEGVPTPPDLAPARMTEPEALAALASRAEELVKRDRFSGALLVARNGKVLFQKAWGLADRAAGTPNTLETKFRIGSMNKMFTSVAILQLVEAGKLSLDDTVGKILADYPNQDIATKVKIRHLLSHTGGTGDIFGPDFVKNRLTLREHADYVKLYGARGLTHEPGAEFRYSNYGFVLLGRIIEKVTGMSYYDYVRTKIFKPAGMTATDSLTEEDKVPNRSVGYFKPAGKWEPNTDTLPWRGTSAGGGYSTVGDFFRFAQALESGKLISKEMLAKATTPNLEGYGFGFDLNGEGPLWSYGHGGGAPGMNGEFRVYPRLGTVVVTLANLDPPAASRLFDFFVRRMPV
jgi:CubicO group peptidase (beta-lactamase class C family)